MRIAVSPAASVKKKLPLREVSLGNVPQVYGFLQAKYIVAYYDHVLQGPTFGFLAELRVQGLEQTGCFCYPTMQINLHYSGAYT